MKTILCLCLFAVVLFVVGPVSMAGACEDGCCDSCDPSMDCSVDAQPAVPQTASAVALPDVQVSGLSVQADVTAKSADRPARPLLLSTHSPGKIALYLQLQTLLI